jgi:hypothetical protein
VDLAPATYLNAQLPLSPRDQEEWRGRHVLLVLDEKDEAFSLHLQFLTHNFGVLEETPQRVRVYAPDGSVLADERYPIKVSYDKQFGWQNVTVKVPADGRRGVYALETFTKPLALPTLAVSSTGKVVHYLPPGERSLCSLPRGGQVCFQPEGDEEVYIGYPLPYAYARIAVLDPAGRLVASTRITGADEGGMPVGEPCRFQPDPHVTGLYTFVASNVDWHWKHEIHGLKPYVSAKKEEWFDPTRYPGPDLERFLYPEEEVMGENLLENGDFEEGPAGPDTRGQFPPEWTQPYGSLERVEVVPEARPGSKGAQCLKINAGEPGSSAGVYSALTPFDPSKPLKARGWTKGGGKKDGNQGYLYFGIGWYDAQKNPALTNQQTEQNYYYLNVADTSEWTNSHTTYIRADQEKDVYPPTEFPPGAAYFDVRLFVIGYDKAAAYFDDIVVTQE